MNLLLRDSRKISDGSRATAKALMSVGVGARELLPDEWRAAAWGLESVKLPHHGPHDFHKKDPRTYTPQPDRHLTTKRRRMSPVVGNEDIEAEVYIFNELYSEPSGFPNDRDRCKDRNGEDCLKRYLNFSLLQTYRLFVEEKRRNGQEMIISFASYRRITKKLKVFYESNPGNIQTAACKTHEQLKSFRECLKSAGVEFRHEKDLASVVFCEESTEDCMELRCNDCNHDFSRNRVDALLERIPEDEELSFTKYVAGDRGPEAITETLRKDDFCDELTTWLRRGEGLGGRVQNHFTFFNFSRQKLHRAGPSVLSHVALNSLIKEVHKTITNQGLGTDTLVIHMDFAMGVRNRYGVEIQDMHFLPGSWPILSSIGYYAGKKVMHHLIGPLRGKKPQMTIYGLQKFLERILSGETLQHADSPARPKRVVIEVDGSSTDFWSGKIWSKIPEIFDYLEKFEWRPTVAMTKSVKGHGKGAIDGAHKGVKDDIRKSLEMMAGQDDPIRRVGYNSASEIRDYLVETGKYGVKENPQRGQGDNFLFEGRLVDSMNNQEEWNHRNAIAGSRRMFMVRWIRGEDMKIRRNALELRRRLCECEDCAVLRQFDDRMAKKKTQLGAK
ncbi:unnamed protein product, partial [Oikopleura dioica]